MRISDWSSDVCSSDLISPQQIRAAIVRRSAGIAKLEADGEQLMRELGWREFAHHLLVHFPQTPDTPLQEKFADMPWRKPRDRSEEHTSELQSLMRISYAVFCLKKKKN